MQDILIQLQTQFSDRFDDFEKVSDFYKSFLCDIEDVPTHLQMSVIDLQSNDALKSSFYAINNLVKFYGSLPSDFDQLKRFAQQFITFFGNTYLGEQTFSIVNYRKNEYASRLLSNTISNTTLNFLYNLNYFIVFISVLLQVCKTLRLGESCRVLNAQPREALGTAHSRYPSFTLIFNGTYEELQLKSKTVTARIDCNTLILTQKAPSKQHANCYHSSLS
nr:unnamed protein product [Callosobruchus chinensis]